MAQAVKDNHQLTGGIEYKEKGVIITSPKDNESIDSSSMPTSLSIKQRSDSRTSYKEAKKQLNIESITAYASEDLSKEQEVTDEPVDPDWAARFFNIAKDISNEEMQALWGRILAGEIKKH